MQPDAAPQEAAPAPRRKRTARSEVVASKQPRVSRATRVPASVGARIGVGADVAESDDGDAPPLNHGDAPPLVHADFSAASLVVLKHAVKQRGLEIPVPASESDLRSALEVHRLFLDAIADCVSGVDDSKHPIPGHYIVECGLEGDCFYHALAFLCSARLPGVSIPDVPLEPLSAAHKALRELVVDELERHGKLTGMDPFFFNHMARKEVGTYTVERWINLFEKMSLQQYCAQQRKLHQFNGVCESVMWVKITGRSLVVKSQDADPIVYCANGKAAFGWRAAAAAVQDQAWVLHHQPQHYCALWPEHRIDHDAVLLPPATLNKNTWAHYKSRNITLKGNALRIPTLVVFKNPDD